MTSLAAAETGISVVTNDVLAFLMSLFAQLKPAVDVIVPLVLTSLVGRWVHNRTIADALMTAAGVAYSHIGTIRTSDPHVLFEDAKRAGIEAGAAAINDVVKKYMSSLTPEEVSSRVDGALGKLLATDPTFQVTQPVKAVALVVPIQ